MPEAVGHSLWDGFAERGYRDLRERPILVLADGRAVILDPTFFSEKISLVRYFISLADVRGGKANEIFGTFGLASRTMPTAFCAVCIPIGRAWHRACIARSTDAIVRAMTSRWMPF